MPEARYFLSMTGYILLGLAVLAVSALFVLLSWSYLAPFFEALLPGMVIIGLIIIAIVVVWIVLYLALIIGISIRVWFKHPVEVSEVDKGYSIDKSKEAGRREKKEKKRSAG